MKTEFALTKTQFTLTKKEFIKRSMKGEVFLNRGAMYFYSEEFNVPFRVDYLAIGNSWRLFDGQTLFTSEEPKPIIERRWKWLKDYDDYTACTNYLTDRYAIVNEYSNAGYYKSDMFIDVEAE